jgi:hypothetical protein
MPCACDQCLQHARTLGLEASASSLEAIRKAYRDAVKLWHPDRFEGDPSHLPAAEEHFKQVQVAYRALTEHNRSPVILSLESIAAKPVRPASLSFGKAPGVFTAPRLPPQVEQIIAAQLGPDHKALAIVDLSRDGTNPGDFSRFLLLASHAVIVRGAEGNDAIIWYTDLGEITLIDHRIDGKLGVWQTVLEKVSGTEQKYTLEIHRRNGAHFFSLSGETDDSVKKVIYNFLLHKKYQPHV